MISVVGKISSSYLLNTEREKCKSLIALLEEIRYLKTINAFILKCYFLRYVTLVLN